MLEDQEGNKTSLVCFSVAVIKHRNYLEEGKGLFLTGTSLKGNQDRN